MPTTLGHRGGRKSGRKLVPPGATLAEPSMCVADFKKLVVTCSEDEVDRLRTRYKRYYREHRQVFTDLLAGRYTDDESLKAALLDARKRAVAERRTSAAPVQRRNG